MTDYSPRGRRTLNYRHISKTEFLRRQNIQKECTMNAAREGSISYHQPKNSTFNITQRITQVTHQTNSWHMLQPLSNPQGFPLQQACDSFSTVTLLTLCTGVRELKAITCHPVASANGAVPVLWSCGSFLIIICIPQKGLFKHMLPWVLKQKEVALLSLLVHYIVRRLKIIVNAIMQMWL